MAIEITLDAATKLLDDFRKLPGLVERPRTFMEIPCEEKERFIHPAHFDYDENLEHIRPVLQDLIDKLATSQEREE